MDKSYIKYYSEGKWSKELEEKILKYKFVRQVYLDYENEIENIEEQNIIQKIQKLLDKEGIHNEEKMNELLQKNKLIEFNKDAKFNIRRIYYRFKEEKIKIINCVVVFLFQEENEFFTALEDFTGIAKVGNLNLKFSLIKKNFITRKNCKETVKELLEGNLEKNLNEVELAEFFKDKTVVYSEEIKCNEIRTLKDAMKEEYSLAVPFVKGILMVFINEKDLDIDSISKIIKDANFYVGAKSDTACLYAVKIDENYKEPKIKVILTI